MNITHASRESSEGKQLTSFQQDQIVSHFAEIMLSQDTTSKKVLFCLVGLVGAGKSTFVDALLTTIPMYRISTDAIREYLQANGYNLEKTTEIAFSVLDIARKKESVIVLDADCIRFYHELNSFADSYGYTIVWIHINPPQAYILNKLNHLDTHKTDHPKVFSSPIEAVENYTRRVPLHTQLLSDIECSYSVDTSSQDDVDTVVKQIAVELDV